MAIFLHTIFSFPTAIFTGLLALVMLYWLIAITGLLDTDVLDQMLLGDGDAVDAGGLAALLNKIGLGRVPLTIIVSLIVLSAWVISFAGTRLLMPQTGLVAIQFLIGAAITAAALIGGLLATIVLLRPVHAMLRHIPPEGEPTAIIGRTGVIRSGTVTPETGQAIIEDGGAGLLLQVRTSSGSLPRGTKVVVIEQLPEHNAWRIVSEDEFTNG